MAILEGTLTVLFVIICVMMILVILIQPGKGEGLGAIAGMSNQTFGGAGPTSFLSKLTAGVAVAYMVLVIALGRVGGSTEIQPATEPEQATESTESTEEGEATETTEEGEATETTEEGEAAEEGEANGTEPAEPSEEGDATEEGEAETDD